MDFKKIYTTVLIIFLLNLSVFNLPIVAQKVVINEVMASNKETISDEDGDFPDWIEIYNAGEIPVNLENWGVSDDTIGQFKWIFPEIILNPTQYLLVFASGKDRRNGEYLHTNFRIKGGLDPVVLFDSKSNKIDEYSPVCIPSNISLGYKPDGSGEKYYFTTPSPGFTNNENSIKYFVNSHIEFLKSLKPPCGIFYLLKIEGKVAKPQVVIFLPKEKSQYRTLDFSYSFKNDLAKPLPLTPIIE